MYSADISPPKDYKPMWCVDRDYGCFWWYDLKANKLYIYTERGWNSASDYGNFYALSQHDMALVREIQEIMGIIANIDNIDNIDKI